MKNYTASEVAVHNKETDCWVILFNEVFDVTTFLNDHPGGKDAIMLFAGQDATEQFDMLHQPSVLQKFGPDYKIGNVKA
jgi:cytochrome b involved in lipid metabolism